MRETHRIHGRWRSQLHVEESGNPRYPSENERLIFRRNHERSIEVGRLADLVILSAANPLTIDGLKLIDIKVLKTIKGGKSMYKLTLQ
jgi:predicted amidohydrolase YtcJ